MNPTLADWIGGALCTIFLAIASLNYRRISLVKKAQHDQDLSLSYLRGKADGYPNEIRLLVLEVLKAHEDKEDEKFDALKEQISCVHTDVEVIKNTIGRAINGPGKH